MSSIRHNVVSSRIINPEGTGDVHIGLTRVLQIIVVGFCLLGHVDSETS